MATTNLCCSASTRAALVRRPSAYACASSSSALSSVSFSLDGKQTLSGSSGRRGVCLERSFKRCSIRKKGEAGEGEVLHRPRNSVIAKHVVSFLSMLFLNVISLLAAARAESVLPPPRAPAPGGDDEMASLIEEMKVSFTRVNDRLDQMIIRVNDRQDYLERRLDYLEKTANDTLDHLEKKLTTIGNLSAISTLPCLFLLVNKLFRAPE